MALNPSLVSPTELPCLSVPGLPGGLTAGLTMDDRLLTAVAGLPAMSEGAPGPAADAAPPAFDGVRECDGVADEGVREWRPWGAGDGAAELAADVKGCTECGPPPTSSEPARKSPIIARTSGSRAAIVFCCAPGTLASTAAAMTEKCFWHPQ